MGWPQRPLMKEPAHAPPAWGIGRPRHWGEVPRGGVKKKQPAGFRRYAKPRQPRQARASGLRAPDRCRFHGIADSSVGCSHPAFTKEGAIVFSPYEYLMKYHQLQVMLPDAPPTTVSLQRWIAGESAENTNKRFQLRNAIQKKGIKFAPAETYSSDT